MAEPSLDDLAVFLAVCRAGGFRTAARWIGSSASRISETVARLEAALGVPLLVRTTRSVRPTEAGQELAERVEPLLVEVRTALGDVPGAGGGVRGTLKLNVPGAVMVDILPPLIDRFLSAHGGVAVELVVDDRLTDLAASGCDAGIRYGEHLGQDMVAVPMAPRVQQIALAAAPAYLAARGVPAHPRELMRHDVIRLRFSSGAVSRWELERGGESLVVDPPARVTVGAGGFQAALALARAGHGIVGTFRNWLQDDLDRGALLPVLPDWWQRFEGPWVYFPRGTVSAPLRAFLQLVAAERDATPTVA